MEITQHAIDRYRLRVRDCSDKEAERQISGLLSMADVEREHYDGVVLLRVGSLRMVTIWGSIVTLYLARQ